MNKHYIKQILTIVLLSLLSLSASAREVVIPEGTKIVDSDSGYVGDTTITSVVIPNSVTKIWEYAFSGCTGLTSVEIPNSVTKIGDGAFKGCTGLTSVEIPNSVTEIGDYAFSGCTGLTSVVIPNSVTKIGDYAFKGCTVLTSVVIPNSVTKIGRRAFEGCTGLTGVEIPNSVTEIGVEAFSGCTGLTSVEIPNSVTYLVWGAFKGCTGLTSVEIPNSVTVIGDYAFSGCTGLTSVVIPNSVTKIGDYAFKGCTGLTSVEIPNSVTEIGDYAFSGCTGLTSVEIPNSVTYLSGFSDCTGLTGVEIPNSVTVIGDGAFFGCTGLTSVEIPNSVTKIGRGAFPRCTGLTGVEIPNSVTEIGEEAFVGCTGLTSIEIPNSVTEIGDYAFKGCTGLTSVEIPNSVTKIGWYAFSGCTALTSVEIPNSVTEIGDYVFSGCTGLTSVEIPNSVTKIDFEAFYGCTNLSRVVCYAVEPPAYNSSYSSYYKYVFSDETLKGTLYVPAKSIDAYKSSKLWGQFKTILPIEGSEFPTVTIDETIRVCEHDLPIMWRGHEIYGDTVLSYNDTLWYMSLRVRRPVVVEMYDTISCGASYKDFGFTIKNPVSGVYTDSLSTAEGCDSIVILHLEVNGELVIPEGTKTISYKDGYHGNKCITTVKIPNSVTEIGFDAFGGCTGLTSVEIPNSVTSLSGFNNCTGLTSIEIPNSVTEIGEDAFYGCTGLTSVEIPNSVTEIGFDAFGGCTGLTSVEIPNSVTEIGWYAFSGCTSLTSVEIPSSVTEIGEGAFSRCTGLTSVEIPNSVTQIDSAAFSHCISLTSVEIPNSVTLIDYEAFYGCTNLSRVVCYAVEPPAYYSSYYYHVFSDETLKGTLYVPAKSIDAYKSSKLWSQFKTILPIEGSEFPTVTIDETIRVCEHDLPIMWRGHEIYGDTVLSFNDTLWYMNLSVQRPVVIEMFDTVFCGASYKDYGFAIKDPVSGVYTDTLSTAAGCDSIVILHLEVNGELVIPDGTKEITYEDGYHGNECITSVKIPNSVTEIGPDAFLGCTGLTSIEIPNSVEYVGRGAFAGCVGLTSIVIPNSVSMIGYEAFYGCVGLTSVVIPNSVTKIDSFVFDGCTGLTSVKIPNSVEYVERGAFAGCVGLTSVELPNSVMMIGQEAFSHCISLTSVEIPNSVTEIGWYAFYGCTGLTSVEIPNSVTEIGTYAFSGCTSLSKVVCYAVEPPAYYSYYYDVFSKETLKGTLYVPAKSIDDYKSSKLWGQFSTILPIEGSELPTVTIDEMIPVCENDLPVIWREHEIYQSDTTFLVSSALSDTLYNIHLDIHASSITKLTAEVKKGEGYELGDSVYYQPGVYDQIYVSAMGCDSIIRLSLSYVEEADTIPNVSDGTAVANLLTTLPDGTNVYYANGLLFKEEKGELLPVMYDSVYAVVGDSVLPQNDSIFIPCSVMIEGKSYDVKSVDMDAACGKLKIETYYSWSYQYKMLDYLKVPDCVEYLNTGYYKWGMNWRSVFDITPNPNLKLEYDSNSVQIYWHDNDALDLMRRDFVNNSYFGVDFYLDDSLLTLIVPDGVDKLRNYHIHNSFDTIVLPNNDLMVGRDNRSFFTYNCNFLSLSNALVDDESQDYFYGGTLITTDVLNLRDWKAWCETSTSDYVTYKKILYQGQEIGNDLLLGEGIQSISTNSFKKFDFNSIYLPSTMTTIEKNAFAKLDLQSLSLSRNIDLSATGIQSADTLFFRGTMAEWCADPVVSIPYNVLVIEGQVYDKNTKSLFVAEGVELIHSQAFSICPNIRTLVLPSTLTEISDGAFKSCISLTTVTCYAPEPPVALGSTFGNYNGYLYIPCDYRPDYDIHVCWGSFKHVECITAESTVVDDVVVEPDHVSADISWPKIDGVVGYTIDISLNGKVILTLNFNEDGQLVNIDFSKALQSVKPAPSQTYALTSLRSAVEGFRFSVTGLEEATTYQYTLKVLGDAGKVIESHSGEFTTLGESNGVEEKPAEMDDFSISVENGIVMVSVDVSIPVSFYNLQGQCLFNHMGSCAFRAPYTGVYVVRCGVKAIKVLVR